MACHGVSSNSKHRHARAHIILQDGTHSLDVWCWPVAAAAAAWRARCCCCSTGTRWRRAFAVGVVGVGQAGIRRSRWGSGTRRHACLGAAASGQPAARPPAAPLPPQSRTQTPGHNSDALAWVSVQHWIARRGAGAQHRSSDAAAAACRAWPRSVFLSCVAGDHKRWPVRVQILSSTYYAHCYLKLYDIYVLTVCGLTQARPNERELEQRARLIPVL